jgi:glucose dehydrogenase
MWKLVRSSRKGNYPPGGQAIPMPYRLSENGKQFVVIAAGGHHTIPSTTRDSLIAFALPE